LRSKTCLRSSKVFSSSVSSNHFLLSFSRFLGTPIPIGYEHPFLLDILNLPGPVPNELLLPGYRQESTGRELLRSSFLARQPSGWERRGRTGVETRWRRERRGGRRSRRDDVGSAGESIKRKKDEGGQRRGRRSERPARLCELSGEKIELVDLLVSARRVLWHSS